jgi:hypothetical protein
MSDRPTPEHQSTTRAHKGPIGGWQAPPTQTTGKVVGFLLRIIPIVILKHILVTGGPTGPPNEICYYEQSVSNINRRRVWGGRDV